MNSANVIIKDNALIKMKSFIVMQPQKLVLKLPK